MTNLTTAAQAVLDAFNLGFDRPVAVHHKPRIAAALRVAANELSYLLPFENSARIDVADLLAIADELEGITYGTYRCNLEAQ